MRTFAIVNCKTLIFYIVLGILTSMPSNVFAWDWEKKDSLILPRIYAYPQYHQPYTDSITDNIYIKLRFNVEKRNATLWLIPTMYSLAKDERQYIRETYSKFLYTNEHDFDIISQVKSGTIRHNRNAMPTLVDLITPKIYDESLFEGYILSPFHKANKRLYKYRQNINSADGTTRIDFTPKLYNTQLLNGYAIVETETGRILRTVFNGEFDMINFRTELNYSNQGGRFITPWRSSTAASFKFAGNRISANLTSMHNCKAELPDSILWAEGKATMDTLRPIPLTVEEEELYEKTEDYFPTPPAPEDTITKKPNFFKKIFWDTIGETLVTPIRAESEQTYFRLSPIIDPLAIRYSDSKGFSYKMKLRFQYTFSPHRYLTFNPYFGYNFKIKQIFFDAPLRMTYNPKRNGYAELTMGNGNRISNSTVAELIKEEFGDTLDFTNMDMNKFKNTYIRAYNNIMLFDWLDIETGLVFHRRSAVNKTMMTRYNMPTVYTSFAPMMGIKILPWEKGPLFTFTWERGFDKIFSSNISYERWESDAQWKIKMPGLRLLNLRAGYGTYSHREQNYFVDFDNFQETNLPDGWNDDWTGDFQLLNGSEFNRSDYYIRANASYESPLMIATWLPYVGKYIEKERFYINSVLLERTRPYYEIGYGFTNRYISVAAFASFKNSHFQNTGFKFDFELFRRW
jgi:hypothetical protein